MEQTEQMKPSRGKTIRTAVFAALLSAAAAVLPLGLVVVPAYLVYAAFAGGITALVTGAAVYVAASFLLYVPTTAAAFSVLFVGIAAVIYGMMKAKKPHAYVVLAAMGAAMVGLYMLVCMPGILSGDGAFAEAQRITDDSIKFMQDAVRTAKSMGAAFDEDALKLLDSYYAAFSADVPKLVVPALAVIAGVIGLANVLFFRLFARKYVEAFHILPLHPFREWRVPNGLTAGLFIMLIGALILNFTGWDYAEGLVGTIEILAVLPFLLQGVCVTDFLIARRSKNPVSMRVVIYILMVILFGAFRTPLLIVGAMDQLLRIRDRANGIPPQMPTDKD